jgi:hypothetical protein
MATASPPFFFFISRDMPQFYFQPLVEIAVPLQVRRPGVATASFRGTLGFFPLSAAGWATTTGTEYVPGMPTQALPMCFAIRVPPAIWAADLLINSFHVIMFV